MLRHGWALFDTIYTEAHLKTPAGIAEVETEGVNVADALENLREMRRKLEAEAYPPGRRVLSGSGVSAN